jgi:hypothetical protein
MAYSSPATVVTATTITSTWGNSVKTAVDYLANPPACRVYHNAAQSLADNTATIIAFNSERYDTASMHDTVTNNSRITIPAAGLYLVTFTGDMANDNDYLYIETLFVLNGATFIAGSTIGASTVAFPKPFLSTVYKFAVNDYVQVRILQDNTSGNANNLSSGGNYSPEFSATWIGLG